MKRKNKKKAYGWSLIGFPLGKKRIRKPLLKDPTEVQALHRAKFGLATSFASKIKEAAQIGFTQGSKKKPYTCLNMLTAIILKYAIVGSMVEDVSLYYPTVAVSSGCRDHVLRPLLRLEPTGTGELEWEIYVPDPQFADSADQIYLLIYNETKDEVIHSGYAGQRSDLKVKFEMVPFEYNDALHCWVFVKSCTNDDVSNSSYVHNVIIALS
ncbi:DUF6266 family protein [Pedobacter hartonius]|uniref:Uncharacterized protein n=1 Tax=Pedobacter hartonius TaxID=425514 RepID=A0A1H4BUF8_9SPHI|nr:DUF6266 family protein [Pedobacter hartonius]SEA51758.1 hypothetical protein SAMN05443550_103472 [Pedobacter hartonius]